MASAGSTSRIWTYDETAHGSGKWPMPPLVCSSATDHRHLSHFVSVHLEDLKVSLNETKGFLSNYDICEWGAHTSRTQPCGDVVGHVRQAFNAELCTNAWCKMYEILATFDLVGSDSAQTSLNSLHLCEAPGAFVCAVNHYVKTKVPHLKHYWLASTLNPSYEGNSLNVMINDDRFIRRTVDKWTFGGDQSGDVKALANVSHIVRVARQRLGDYVTLVTADGSVDCQDEPAEQERVVYSLLAAETLAALQVLAVGGSFVLKTFTAFEANTTALVYLLNATFSKVSVFKPSTSKPGNSEVYAICQGYLGAQWLTEDAESAFASAIQHEKPLFDPHFIPASFVGQHVDCCKAFKEWQEETIVQNIDLYETQFKRWRGRVRLLRTQCCADYVERCSLEWIADEHKIISQRDAQKQTSTFTPRGSSKRLSGNFYERSCAADMPWNEYVQGLDYYDPPPTELSWTKAHCHGLEAITFHSCSIVTGKRLASIESSQFCDNELVAALSTFIQRSQETSSLGLPAAGDVTTDTTIVSSILQQFSEPGDTGDPEHNLDPCIVQLDNVSDEAVANARHCLNASSTKQAVLLVETGYDWMELPHRQRFLASVLAALQCFQSAHVICSNSETDDTICTGEEGSPQQQRHLLVPCSTLLTRFSAACLYILWNYFDEVSVAFTGGHPSSSCPRQGPLIYLACRHYVGLPAPVDSECMGHLKRVLNSVTNVHEEVAVDVLEFLPTDLLFEDNYFMEFVMATNQDAAKVLINWLLAQAKQQTAPPKHSRLHDGSS